MLATARHGRDGWAAPLLLATAGLLRPEAWLLAFAWAAWAAPARRRATASGSRRSRSPRPPLWAAQDLAATGDPFFSLHATRDLAAQLARPRGLEDALRLAPASLRATLTEPVVWLGLAGAAVALVRLDTITFLPAAVAGLGLVTFLVLGIAGLPVLTRYLLLPATMLALWCAVAAAGFTVPARAARCRGGSVAPAPCWSSPSRSRRSSTRCAPPARWPPRAGRSPRTSSASSPPPRHARR